jgi:hypothetical protein
MRTVLRVRRQRITARRQRAVAALEIGRGKIVEYRLAIAQMTACQALLDTVGSFKKPVHGGVEGIGTDALDVPQAYLLTTFDTTFRRTRGSAAYGFAAGP